MRDRVSDLHIFERHIQRMMSVIPRDGSTINIADLLYKVTLDSATDFLLGESVNSIEHGSHAFALAFQQIQEHMNNVSRAGPLRHFLKTKQFKENLKILNNFVEPFVEKTLHMRPEELKGKSESDYNFLHALAEFTRDPKMLRDQLVAVLLAARVYSNPFQYYVVVVVDIRSRILRPGLWPGRYTNSPNAQSAWSALEGRSSILSDRPDHPPTRI